MTARVAPRTTQNQQQYEELMRQSKKVKEKIIQDKKQKRGIFERIFTSKEDKKEREIKKAKAYGQSKSSKTSSSIEP